MKRGYRYSVDLEILLSLCKILNISIYEMQKNIIAYKTRRGHNYIEKPKLPVEITPIFDLLIAHFMGDGYVINQTRGRKHYFGYRQYNDQYRGLFIKKIESVFGKLKYKRTYFNERGNTRVYFPVVGSDLMFKLYNLDAHSFKSEKARIPEGIFSKDSKHGLSFLIGIIIDEGNIDSNLIVIRMKNKELIQDLQKICSELNYVTSMTKGKKGIFCLYILSKSVKKFYQDYQNLLKEYPEVNLGYKGEKIREFIKRTKKQKLYRPGNKPLILKALSKGNLTVNELAQKLNMTRQGARYLINKLIKENKVEVKSVVKFGNYKHGLR